MKSGPHGVRRTSPTVWLATGAAALAILCCAGTSAVWHAYDVSRETAANARAMILNPAATELEQRQAIVVLDRDIRANMAALRAAKLPTNLEPHRANALTAGR